MNKEDYYKLSIFDKIEFDIEMKTDLELLKEYLQSEIDCGNHKLFIFDENNNATELKTIDGLNAIIDLEQEIERLNNIIENYEQPLKFLKNRIKQGMSIEEQHKNFIWYVENRLQELKESGNK